jgi:hypothetical protein
MLFLRRPRPLGSSPDGARRGLTFFVKSVFFTQPYFLPGSGKGISSMNRTLNTVIYVVCSTLLLTLSTLIVFFALFLPLVLLLPTLDPSLKTLFIGVIFIAALLGGLFIFNTVLKKVVKKFDIEQYLLQRKEKPKKPGNQGTM